MTCFGCGNCCWDFLGVLNTGRPEAAGIPDRFIAGMPDGVGRLDATAGVAGFSCPCSMLDRGGFVSGVMGAVGGSFKTRRLLNGLTNLKCQRYRKKSIKLYL